VLRALERLGLEPAIIAGVSVGAINAVLWLAHGFRTGPLEKVWRSLRQASIGMRWVTLALRAAGLFIIAFGTVEAVLALAGSPELAPGRIFGRMPGRGMGVDSAMLDAAAWAALALLGLAALQLTHQAEEGLAHLTPPADPTRLQRWFGRVLLAAWLVHATALALSLPWPHRFSATLLLIGTFVWIANHPRIGGRWMRRLVLHLMPETGGRGLWSNAARRRLIEQVVRRGDPANLVRTKTHLIMSACGIDSGRMAYFINWPDPSPGFRERIEAALGQVMVMSEPRQAVEAALASSAVPVVFRPVRIGKREFVDGGVFSNQPLHAIIADEADAALVVLVSPSDSPPKTTHEPNLVELGSRLLELANWRDLKTEMRSLPDTWREPGRDGRPARLCVVEPDHALPGGLYGFAPDSAERLMDLGEADALMALARAGWLAPRTGEAPDV